MRLPGNSVGISDILGYRECPQRFALGMRRHIELPEEQQLEPGEKDEPPEATNWTNAYGSAVHEALALVEREGYVREDAVALGFSRYGNHLDPEDLQMLGDDLKAYERRRVRGASLVGAEEELKVPLFWHEGVQIYFRFRLDLLQRLDSNPSVFIHRDYKSSKWRKSSEEVHSDRQMWAYNWAIHELFPECKKLIQIYDQLRFGEEKTSKSAAQRQQMKEWLIANVKIILADETLKPKLNDFCRYCALVLTCREPRRAAADTRAMLALLAPLTKEGRKLRVEFAEEGGAMERLIEEELPDLIQTRKHIEHVEKALKAALAEMPGAARERLGWRLRERRSRAIAPEGLRELHEAMGDSFYQLVSLPITRLEELVGKPKKGEAVPAELEIARSWTLENSMGTDVIPASSAN